MITTTKNLQKKSHIEHCTHTTESANLTVQTYFRGEITLHVAQTVNTEQRFMSGIRRCIQKSQDNAHNTQVACSSRVSR